MNGERFRQALGQFATGIVIITTRNGVGRPRAITVNAFTSVSLDPPLVLFCLGKSSFHFDVFAEAQSFAINVLRADQQALSNRFAKEAEDDLADLATRSLMTGSPILPGYLAALDCTTETQHDAGDHLIVIGRVLAIDEIASGEPLVYFESGYRGLRPLPDA
ncbi:MAG: flavin reductase family protein [Geminicoccaceae bacterium]